MTAICAPGFPVRRGDWLVTIEPGGRCRLMRITRTAGNGHAVVAAVEPEAFGGDESGEIRCEGSGVPIPEGERDRARPVHIFGPLVGMPNKGPEGGYEHLQQAADFLRCHLPGPEAEKLYARMRTSERERREDGKRPGDHTAGEANGARGGTRETKREESGCTR